MIDALYIAASALDSQQKQIDVISDNLANLHTPGFRRARVAFTDVTATTPEQALAGAASNAVGAGTQILETAPVMVAGAMQQTGNPLDIAIRGAGFLEVETTDGQRLYTRAGRLQRDREGYLVAANGLRLSQGIQIPPDATDISISANGEVRAQLGGDHEKSLIGTLQLARFTAPEALRSVGGSDFAATPASGDPMIGKPGEAGVGTVEQGYIEGSNVDLVGAMSALVLAQRAYQLNARVLQATDQILDTINNLNR